MDSEEAREYMGKLIPNSYVDRASDAKKMRDTLIKVLLKDRRIPKKGEKEGKAEGRSKKEKKIGRREDFRGGGDSYEHWGNLLSLLGRVIWKVVKKKKKGRRGRKLGGGDRERIGSLSKFSS